MHAASTPMRQHAALRRPALHCPAPQQPVRWPLRLGPHPVVRAAAQQQQSGDPSGNGPRPAAEALPAAASPEQGSQAPPEAAAAPPGAQTAPTAAAADTAPSVVVTAPAAAQAGQGGGGDGTSPGAQPAAPAPGAAAALAPAGRSWREQLPSLLPKRWAVEPALAAFLVGGAAICALLFGWAKGSPLRRSHPYQFTIMFDEASKVDVGTQVRMQGVQVGTIRRVSVTCEAVSAVAEVADGANAIPLASRIDVNQLGLASDPYVDITPPADVAACALAGRAGPRGARCADEGAIICHGATVQGHGGGSFDYLMKFTLATSDRKRTRDVTDD